MSAIYEWTWIALQGASWVALFLGLARSLGRMPADVHGRCLNLLLPFWCVAAAAISYAYGMEAFVAFYGANPYEGFALVKDGKAISGNAVLARLWLTVIACLLPFLLIPKKLRARFPLVLGVSLLSWFGVVVAPVF